jgi:putative ABC transport system ATP-binding protein
MSVDSAIHFENVSKTYGSTASSTAALKGLTLTVAQGEFLAMVGPSGSGKSTFLNLAAALDVPDGGRIRVLGRDLLGLSDDERSDLRLSSIGFVFQAFNLLPAFTAMENVSWPLEFSGVGRREVQRRVREMLARVGLDAGKCRRRPAELSGGEQQRVAIARALITEAELLLADEPTGNLDSSTSEAILELLRELNEERRVTVVLVTHSMLAAGYARRVVALRDGRLAEEGAGTVAYGSRRASRLVS